MSYFRRVRLKCKVESFYTTSAEKKVDAYSVDAFVDSATLCSKLLDAVIKIFHVEKRFLFSLERES